MSNELKVGDVVLGLNRIDAACEGARSIQKAIMLIQLQQEQLEAACKDTERLNFIEKCVIEMGHFPRIFPPDFGVNWYFCFTQQDRTEHQGCGTTMRQAFDDAMLKAAHKPK